MRVFPIKYFERIIDLRSGLFFCSFSLYINTLIIVTFNLVASACVLFLTISFLFPLRPLCHRLQQKIKLWFDKKLSSVDGLCFSRSPLLSVYADMSTCCEEYASDTNSMLELVFAPCSPMAGSGNKNWIAAPDEEIVDATMNELERLFPTEIGDAAGKHAAKLTKSTVVKVPRSVYAATPGRNKYRPSQQSPISNFIMAGDFATQKYLGSMEGAVLSGKLAAEVICDLSEGRATKGLKEVHSSVEVPAEEKKTIGNPGNSPIAFGGGQQGNLQHP